MKVSILGCGWLGLPLGAELVRRGHLVRGSVTRNEGFGALMTVGIVPHRLELTPAVQGDSEGFFTDDFFAADALVISLPPKRSQPGVQKRYPAQLEAVLERTPETTRIVFTSSTSVYPELNRSVTEDDAGGELRASGRAVLEAETRLRERGATILRLAGLYGYDRLPGRRLSGRVVQGGNAPVNLVHRDDALGVLLEVLERTVHNVTLNVCADAHPSRREVYTRQAERHGFPPPHFSEPHDAPFKVVSSARLKAVLGYSFRYPDPLEPAP